MIRLISIINFSDAFPAFTCAIAIGNLWSICLGVNVLSPSPYFVLYLASDTILEWLLKNLLTFSRDS